MYFYFYAKKPYLYDEYFILYPSLLENWWFSAAKTEWSCGKRLRRREGRKRGAVMDMEEKWCGLPRAASCREGGDRLLVEEGPL